MPWRTLAAWKRLGRRHYAANAGLARGALPVLRQFKNTEAGLNAWSHASASLNNLLSTIGGIFHFGCLQHVGDQAYRQQIHDYDSIHESYLSKIRRMTDSWRQDERLRQTCLGSNADKKAMRTCRGGKSEAHRARLGTALKQLSFSPIAKCDSSFLRIYRYSRPFGRCVRMAPFFCSHRSFTLLRLGSDGALPHIDSLRTTPKISSHWAFILLIRQCGCSTAIGDNGCVCLVLK